MKRSPLKRKAPLRRGQSTLKKSRLKPKSKNRAKRDLEYRAAHRADPDVVRPVDAPHLLLHKDNYRKVQRHHPRGRSGAHILFYVYITTELHEKIHAQGTWAREVGWLAAEFDGLPHDPLRPKPWDSTVTTKRGLLWKNGEIIHLPEADAVAVAHGFRCAEQMVEHLESIAQK